MFELKNLKKTKKIEEKIINYELLTFKNGVWVYVQMYYRNNLRVVVS